MWRRNTAAMPNHPVRDEIDLLDGHWYSTEPHDDWTWMREHAPVYYDAVSNVCAITKYDDVLTIEKDAKGFYVFESVSTNQEGKQTVKGTWTNIVRGV